MLDLRGGVVLKNLPWRCLIVPDAWKRLRAADLNWTMQILVIPLITLQVPGVSAMTMVTSGTTAGWTIYIYIFCPESREAGSICFHFRSSGEQIFTETHKCSGELTLNLKALSSTAYPL